MVMAPLEQRAPLHIVEHQASVLDDAPHLRALCDGMSEIVLILNTHRQIVLANAAATAQLRVAEGDELRGMRPGEALRCRRAQGRSGCGTSPSCRLCGADEAIRRAAHGHPSERECRVLTSAGKAFDLRVRVTLLRIGTEPLLLFAATDISHEKRRHALERIFFHDVLNSVEGVRMLCAALMRSATGSMLPGLQSVLGGVSRLGEQLRAHRDLAGAEAEDLTLAPAEVDSEALARDAIALCGTTRGGPVIKLDPGTRSTLFQSDQALVSRVLSNMLRNAVEASTSRDSVTVGTEPRDEGVAFWVHNPAVMSADVQAQVFQRSFSTKSHDRGLGTYGMKLLTETYLGGRVSFESAEGSGTTFTTWYPQRLP